MLRKQVVVNLQSEDQVIEALTFNRENGYSFEIVGEDCNLISADCVALIIKSGYTLTVSKNNKMIFYTKKG